MLICEEREESEIQTFQEPQSKMEKTEKKLPEKENKNKRQKNAQRNEPSITR